MTDKQLLEITLWALNEKAAFLVSGNTNFPAPFNKKFSSYDLAHTISERMKVAPDFSGSPANDLVATYTAMSLEIRSRIRNAPDQELPNACVCVATEDGSEKRRVLEIKAGKLVGIGYAQFDLKDCSTASLAALLSHIKC